MKLEIVDNAILNCEEHLKATNSSGTEIEALLTRAVLILTCAAFEECIEHIIENRTKDINDIPLRRFYNSCVSSVFRSTKSTEIAGLIGRFGPEFKEYFKNKADIDQVAVTYYNNIVTNRHGVAHSSGVNCTFNEFKEFYERGHIILDHIHDSIKETLKGSTNQESHNE